MAMERTYEDRLGSTAKAVSDVTGQQMDRARESAETMAKSVVDQSRRAVSVVDRSLRDHPIIALAAVAAFALAIGALWKLDRRRY